MKLFPPNRHNATAGLRTATSLAVIALLPLLLYADAPSWWTQRGVLLENGTPDDYAPANQGQLRNIAKAAAAELDAKLPGGAGDTIHLLIQNWSTSSNQRNDFAPLNLGQLKNVAKPFYDRLIVAGLVPEYPWTNPATAPDDFAIANIGQVKKLFSFEIPAVDPLFDGDQNGLPDAWERQYFNGVGVDPNGDPDGDGITNRQEYLQHTDPTDFFNGALAALSVSGGGDQRGDPGTLLPMPVSIRVTDIDGFGVPNAPLTVMIAQGGALLVPDTAGTSAPSTQLALRTNAYDNDGYPVAQFYVQLPSNPDVTIIRASAQAGIRSMSVSTSAVATDASLVAPSNLTVIATSSSTATLTWTAAVNNLPTTVQASVDGGKTWITLGTVAAGLSQATVTGLTPDHQTKFRVFAGGTPSGNNGSSFALPDFSSGPPPVPPPGPPGGSTGDPSDVTPLSAPVLEVDQAQFDYLRRGGYLGLRNSGKFYKSQKIVVASDFRNEDGSEATSGSTTQTFTTIPGHRTLGLGDREVVSVQKTGDGGVLTIPYHTTIWTDTVLQLDGYDLLFGSTSRKTVTLSDPYTDADAETAGANAELEFYGEFYEPEIQRSFDAVFHHGGGAFNIVVTKYRFRVNADPNTVVTWDIQFTPDDNGKVQHDIQSWRGNGLLYSPEYELDPRKLNDGKSGAYRIVVIAPELMVDGNRDGVMSFGNARAQSADQTSEEKPYRFWVNDDDDGSPGDPGDHVPARAPDYADGTIQSIRDLEDFARLHVNVTGLECALESNTIQAAFEWKSGPNNPKIKLYRATAAGAGYLTDESAANSALLYPFRDTLGEVAPGSPLFMPSGFWVTKSGFFNVPKTLPQTWLLFEGSGEGKGELVLSFWQDGHKIAETPSVWLELKKIQTMYQRAIATPETLSAPYESNGTVDDDSISYVPDITLRFEPPTDETPQCLIFVHGWKATETDAANVGQTMYKRLWWQGFSGRFATFRWPTYTSVLSYNSSEWRAWKFGKSLYDYVTKYVKQQLPSYTISIAAHSMGNVVTGSALRRGLTIDNYLMMQAAIPAGCYNDSVNNYARFLAAETSKPTPDSTAEMGYRLLLQSARQRVGHFVSFFNLNDYALATGLLALPGWPFETNWEKNEENYKPDAGGGGVYVYQGNGVSYFMRPRSEVRQIVDLHESLAFVARPRSKAAGAEIHNATVFGTVSNLEASCNFGSGVADHSGQFERPIQQLAPFYKRVVDELK